MKKIKGTKKMMKHLLKSSGLIHFDLVCTSYGVSSELLLVSDQINDTLESALRSFDYDFHSESGLESGDSREYVFYLEKNTLMCKLRGELHHSDYGDFPKRLYEEVIREIARMLEISEEKFKEDYYVTVQFESDKSSESDEFIYGRWDNDEEIKLNPKQVLELKKYISQFSKSNSANRYERECQFSYNLNSESQYITEYWEDVFDVTNELDDKVNYEFE
jgi:hypothetical protein